MLIGKSSLPPASVARFHVFVRTGQRLRPDVEGQSAEWPRAGTLCEAGFDGVGADTVPAGPIAPLTAGAPVPDGPMPASPFLHYDPHARSADPRHRRIPLRTQELKHVCVPVCLRKHSWTIR
jgi:hypothetical protein